MDFFEKLNKEFYWIGGLQLDSGSGTKYRSFTILCISFVTCFSFCTSCIWALLFDIQTIGEHAECVYFSLLSMLLTLWLFIFIWYENDYWQFIDEISEMIKTSK